MNPSAHGFSTLLFYVGLDDIHQQKVRATGEQRRAWSVHVNGGINGDYFGVGIGYCQRCGREVMPAGKVIRSLFMSTNDTASDLLPDGTGVDCRTVRRQFRATRSGNITLATSDASCDENTSTRFAASFATNK
jgi:hypothetical protein